MRNENEDDLRTSHRAALEQQEDLPAEKGAGPAGTDKAERMDSERQAEREQGLTAKRRGSQAAPSDRPENDPPHPQDVNEISETS
jgi:hypothetical protein